MCRPRADGAEEFLTVHEDALAGVPIRKSEIQDAPGGLLVAGRFSVARGRDLALASRARAESVREPTEARQSRGLENLQAINASQTGQISGPR